MSTLLLRLAGPMQSWGTQSRFTSRDTGLEPSKSGVIGLLCAALGRPRSAPLHDLALLQMGVRVDRPGKLSREYQTAGGTHRLGDTYGIITADGKSRRAAQSTRYYLADADFLVGLQGDEAVLRNLDEALAAPVWQIFLGRKSFPPGQPVRLPPDPPAGPGLRPTNLESTLRHYPWPERRHEHDDEAPPRLRLIIDIGDEQAAANHIGANNAFGMPVVEVRQDVPISFESRQFGVRHVRSTWLERPQEVDTDVSVPIDAGPA